MDSHNVPIVLIVITTLYLCSSSVVAVPAFQEKNYHELRISKDFLLTQHNVCLLDRKYNDTDNDRSFFWKNVCDSDICKTLYKDLKVQVNKTVNPCSNIYEYACGSDTDYLTNDRQDVEELERIFKPVQMFKYLENTEHKAPIIWLADTERILYHRCLDFGNTNGFESVELIEKIGKGLKSPIIEEWLGKYGERERSIHWMNIAETTERANYVFFDVSVTYHPNKSNKNIILLRPPTKKSGVMNNLEYLMSDYRKKVTTGYLGKYFDKKYEKHVRFTHKFLEIYKKQIGTLKGYSLMTIRDLNKTLKKNDYVDPHVETDWLNLFQQVFKPVGYEINDDEYILVDNLPYFKDLSELLKTSTQDIIEFAIQMKFFAEFLPYSDDKMVPESLKDDKETFCANEIELFGTSYKFIKMTFEYFKFEPRSVYTMKNILSAYKSKFERSPLMNEELLNYLKVELQEIAEVLIKGEWKESEISNYYHYFFSGNHIKDLISYRDTMKLNILRTLNDTSGKAIRPFSIAEKYPAREFVISYYAYGIQPELEDLRGIYFGIEGLKMARILTTITNKRLWFGVVNYDPIYSERLMGFHEDVNEFYSVKMSYDLQALTIAYKAMFEDCYNDRHEQFVELTPSKKILKTDELFFLSFLKTHCNNYSDLDFNFISSIFYEYATVLHCKDPWAYAENKTNYYDYKVSLKSEENSTLN